MKPTAAPAARRHPFDIFKCTRVGQVELGEAIWSGAVVCHAPAKTVDVATRRPADFALQVGKSGRRCTIKARPLLAVACLEFHAVAESGKGRVLLEVIELPVGPKRQLLCLHRRQCAEGSGNEGHAEEKTHRHGPLHRMMATWPVSGAIGRSTSFNSMT